MCKHSTSGFTLDYCARFQFNFYKIIWLNIRIRITLICICADRSLWSAKNKDKWIASIEKIWNYTEPQSSCVNYTLHGSISMKMLWNGMKWNSNCQFEKATLFVYDAYMGDDDTHNVNCGISMECE